MQSELWSERQRHTSLHSVHVSILYDCVVCMKPIRSGAVVVWHEEDRKREEWKKLTAKRGMARIGMNNSRVASFCARTTCFRFYIFVEFSSVR